MDSDQIAIDRFCQYLRIRTVQPNPDYAKCTKFLHSYAEELGLSFEVFECVPGKPIVLMSWTGSEPELKGILLNSHTDVVPVDWDKWSVDPFAAELDEKNRIVARGSQDMKCVGIGYLEAIRRLKASGFMPKRTVILSFVPDEEIGGEEGMKMFVKTEKFKSLNIGVALDEGVPSPFKHLFIFNDERAPCWIRLVARGVAGHGSTLPQGSATEKLFRVMEKIYKFRDEQIKHLAGKIENLGEVTSVNVTKMQAGIQTNVIPTEASITIDVRVSPKLGEEAFEKLLAQWTTNPDVEVIFEQHSRLMPASPVDPESEHYQALASSLKEMGFEHANSIFAGATDSRFIRETGIPAYGISPFNLTPILLHDHDEYMHKDVFLKGIQVYEKMISKLVSE